MNTYNSFCIGACLFIIFIAMGSTFLSALDAFPDVFDYDLEGTNDTSRFENLTQNITGSSDSKGVSFDTFWIIATGGVAITGAIVLGILMQSTNIIGVWIFGTVFWSCWSKLIVLFSLFDITSSAAGAALVAMITVGMMFIFIGAIIGMLSQSGGMR